MIRYITLIFLWFAPTLLFAQTDSLTLNDGKKVHAFDVTNAKEVKPLEGSLLEWIDKKELYASSQNSGYHIRAWFYFDIDTLGNILEKSIEVLKISGMPTEDLKLREDFVNGCKKYILNFPKLRSVVENTNPLTTKYYLQVSIIAE